MAVGRWQLADVSWLVGVGTWVMSRDITKIQNFQKKSAGSPLGWCGTRLLRYLAVGGWHVGWQLPIGSWQLAIGDVTWPLAVGLRQVTSRFFGGI